MPLFCTGCGKEVFPGEIFCSKCGKRAVPEAEAQSLSPPVSLHQPESAPRVEPPSHEVNLSTLYTRDWRGVCPSCKFVHTVETCSCPNDASPLVVAFDDTKFGIIDYPVHAATIRCLNDCGFYANAIACIRCGTTIMGRNISFGLPRWVVRLHRALILVSFLLFIVLMSGMLGLYKFYEPNHKALPFSLMPKWVPWFLLGPGPSHFLLEISLLVVTGAILRGFSPFSRFNFANVQRAAKRHAKAVAQQDAIATAKAVQAATRPLFRDNYS